MHCLGYVASFVTVVTSLLVHSRLLCGGALKAELQQQRGRRDLGALSFKYFKSNFFTKLQTAAFKL